MTPEEFKQRMIKLYSEDPENTGCDEEICHTLADNLMCEILEELGYGEGVRLFKLADKWYA